MSKVYEIQFQGKSIFHKTLPATRDSPTSATAVNWHLQVKDTKYHAGLTKKLLHHSQHAKNQLNLF